MRILRFALWICTTLSSLQANAIQCDPKIFKNLIQEELGDVRDFTRHWLANSKIFADDIVEDFVENYAFSKRVTVHFEYGFNGLKDVNGISKDLGTAIANMGETNLKLALEELLKKNPDLEKMYKIHLYNDFKTVRLGFEPKDLAKQWSDKQFNDFFKALVKSAAEKNNKSLTGSVFKDLNIKADVNKWFLAGAGESLDESALLARQCRLSVCSDGFSGFQSTESQLLLKNADKMRVQVISTLDSLSGQSKVLKIGAQVIVDGRVRPEILEVVKKYKDNPQQLVQELRYATGFKGSNTELAALSDSLKKYYSLVDNFQPAVLSKRRELLELPGRGGISADVKGLGILNVDETQKALLVTKDKDLKSAIAMTREGEKTATAKFFQSKAELKTLLNNRLQMREVCSGDDCLSSLNNGAQMTAEQRDNFVQAVLNEDLQNKFRFTLVPDSKNAVQISSNLENVEKATVEGVKSQLRDHFTIGELSQLSYFVDGASNSKQVALIVGVAKNGSPQLVAKVQKFKAEILSQFQAAAHKNSPGSVISNNVKIIQGK